ncbi:CLUMA_CG014261, isoform A [Clunio marinus]|uniref:CLUMA_CG014261, isoform A n=1 Tax=Clunio marinus TaxID=568069 RepID=A0A1J1IMG5_9DIPT|nr:CLUMA_CG014261, isoform A [Clunio marinus]
MEYSVGILLLCLTISSFLDYSLACQGYKLKVHYLRNCGDIEKNVIKIQENSTIKITKDCQIVPNSCAETAGFKTALVKYQVSRNNIPILKNQLDACEMVTKVTADMRNMMTLFGLPNKCPIEAMKKCDEGKTADIDKFKKFISLAVGGPIKIELKIDHDNGKTCLESEFEVVK